MTLDKKQVEHIAKLARLGLANNEKQKFQKELSAILDFVAKLEKVETASVEPMAQATGLKNIFRQDQKKEKSKKETDKIVNLFPDKIQRQDKVKAIL